MSALESRRVVGRVASKRRELGAEDFAGYALLALGMLAHQAPEVASFVMDRVDEQLASVDAMADAPGDES